MNMKIILQFIMFILNLIIPFIISFIFISYIRNLEKKDCKCSNDIRRKYIKYYGYFFFIISILIIILALINSKNIYIIRCEEFIKYICLIINLLGAYVIYKYSEILEDNNCKCSDSWKKIFIKYYSYFLIGTMSIIFFCTLMIFFTHIIFQEEKYIYFIKYLFRNCHLN